MSELLIWKTLKRKTKGEFIHTGTAEVKEKKLLIKPMCRCLTSLTKYGSRGRFKRERTTGRRRWKEQEGR